jgi:hypothetical protein
MAMSQDDRGETRDGGEASSGSGQKGAQEHAEGEHGAKTHARMIEQLHSPPPEEPRDAMIERKREEGAVAGKRRLVEDRQQHDEGEKNSERNRLGD